MYTFPQLIKEIRAESGLNQQEFAKVLNVSKPLIAMIETGQKEVTKKFIIKLSEKLEVNPGAITPFIFSDELSNKKLNSLEKKLLDLGESLQIQLIKKRAKKLGKING